VVAGSDSRSAQWASSTRRALGGEFARQPWEAGRDAPSEVLFELAAACAPDLEAGRCCRLGGGGDPEGFPDPGRAVEDDQLCVPAAGGVARRVYGVEFAFALKDDRPIGRLHHQLRGQGTGMRVRDGVRRARCFQGIAVRDDLRCGTARLRGRTGATSCTPIGSPLVLIPSGRLMAGWPVMLNSGVNGPYSNIDDIQPRTVWCELL